MESLVVSNHLLFDTAALDIFQVTSCSHVLEFLLKYILLGGWYYQSKITVHISCTNYSSTPEFLFLCILFSIWYFQHSEHLSFFLAIQHPEHPSYVWRISNSESPPPTIDVNTLIPTRDFANQTHPHQIMENQWLNRTQLLLGIHSCWQHLHSLFRGLREKVPEAIFYAGIGDTVVGI